MGIFKKDFIKEIEELREKLNNPKTNLPNNWFWWNKKFDSLKNLEEVDLEIIKLIKTLHKDYIDNPQLSRLILEEANNLHHSLKIMQTHEPFKSEASAEIAQRSNKMVRHLKTLLDSLHKQFLPTCSAEQILELILSKRFFYQKGRTIKGSIYRINPLLNEDELLNSPEIIIYLIKKKVVLDREKVLQVYLFLTNDLKIREKIEKFIYNHFYEFFGQITQFIRGFLIYSFLIDMLRSKPEYYLKTVQIFFLKWTRMRDYNSAPEIVDILMESFASWDFEAQKNYVPGLTKPLTERDVYRMYARTKEIVLEPKNMRLRKKTNSYNKKLVEMIISKQFTFTKKDLYHQSDLSRFKFIVHNGLLCSELSRLSFDASMETIFLTDFWNFDLKTNDFTKVISEFKRGTGLRNETQITLVLLNSSTRTIPPNEILYENEIHGETNKFAKVFVNVDGLKQYPIGETQKHAVVLIGASSTNINFVFINEEIKNKYKEIAKKLPFYIPAFSKKGELLFTYEEYKKSKP
jgi:hypothetical protein